MANTAAEEPHCSLPESANFRSSSLLSLSAGREFTKCPFVDRSEEEYVGVTCARM